MVSGEIKMFNINHLEAWKCDYCKQPFHEKPENWDEWGMFHDDCAESGREQVIKEFREAEEEYTQEMLRIHKRDQKLLRKLRKRLPKKVMEWIDSEIREHGDVNGGYQIVTLNQCRGHRTKGADYFGDSRCSIRTVYDNVSSGGYPCEDCYSGDVYIYIGNGQYFQMYVNG